MAIGRAHGPKADFANGDSSAPTLNKPAVSTPSAKTSAAALRSARAAEMQAEACWKAAQLNIRVHHVLGAITVRSSRHLVSVRNLVQGEHRRLDAAHHSSSRSTRSPSFDRTRRPT